MFGDNYKDVIIDDQQPHEDEGEMKFSGHREEPSPKSQGNHGQEEDKDQPA